MDGGSRGMAIFFQGLGTLPSSGLLVLRTESLENFGFGVSLFPRILVGAEAPNFGSGVSLAPNMLVGALALADGSGVADGVPSPRVEPEVLGGAGAGPLLDEPDAEILLEGLRGCGE